LNSVASGSSCHRDVGCDATRLEDADRSKATVCDGDHPIGSNSPHVSLEITQPHSSHSDLTLHRREAYSAGAKHAERPV
jgi:hypothetical protein